LTVPVSLLRFALSPGYFPTQLFLLSLASAPLKASQAFRLGIGSFLERTRVILVLMVYSNHILVVHSVEAAEK